MKKDANELNQLVALFRYGLIADVVCLEPGAKGLYAKLKEKAALDYVIPGSSRTSIAQETLRSWIKDYRKDGFDALYPKTRTDKGRSRILSTEIEDILVEIKENDLKLSVAQVIKKARKQNQIDENQELSESIVYRLLSNRGLMDKRKIEEPGGKDHRRFSYSHAGELFMSDVMHGPAVFTEGRKKQKAYLIAFIDDATRVIPYAEFALGEKSRDLLPVLKQAIMRRGIPKRLFVDNGSAFRSRHLAIVCARLGITLIHSKAYHAAAKGKIERWFRTIRQQFLPTLEDHQKASLANLNQALWAYVEGEYHHNIHRTLAESPLDRWARCSERVRFPEPGVDLEEIFLAEDKRKVHKDRTISLHGKAYEAEAALVGETVILRYDPTTPGQPIQVWFKGNRYDDARLVDTLANCYVKRERPDETLSTEEQSKPDMATKPNVKSANSSMNFSKFSKK
ncbi:MAG: DDE-type integrase/transposase/recombinase [Pseudomonadota bacterium]|nr:DDE-type integrase/transposase/recombinase [Pseudomonadota bacterium]